MVAENGCCSSLLNGEGPHQKLLVKLTNVYMSMMLNLMGSVGAMSVGNGFGGKRIPKARQVPIAYSNEEFD